MLKKISIFIIIALLDNCAYASHKPEREKPQQEETAPTAKNPKIENAASQSSTQSKAATSLAASPALDTSKQTSHLVAATTIAAAPTEQKSSKTKLLDILEVVPERNLQNIILEYLQSDWKIKFSLKVYSVHGIRSANYSRDGKYIASGDYLGDIKIWDTATGAEVKTLKGHDNCVYSVAWSPHGDYIASGGNEIKIWNVKTGRCIKTLPGHQATWSPDGTQLASSLLGDLTKNAGTNSYTTRNAGIKIWDVATWEKVQVQHTDKSAASIAWSPDGHYVATTLNDHTIMILPVKPGKRVKILEGHTEQINSIAWNPNSKQLVSSSNDLTIRIWDIEAGTEIKKIEARDHVVTFVTFSRDGTQLTTASYDGAIRIWNPETGRLIDELKKKNVQPNKEVDIRSLSYSPDGNSIAAGSRSGITVWQNQAAELEQVQEDEINKQATWCTIS